MAFGRIGLELVAWRLPRCWTGVSWSLKSGGSFWIRWLSLMLYGWMSQRRPQRSFDLLTLSVSNAPVSGLSARFRPERQLSKSANAYSRPFAAVR